MSLPTDDPKNAEIVAWLADYYGDFSRDELVQTILAGYTQADLDEAKADMDKDAEDDSTDMHGDAT